MTRDEADEALRALEDHAPKDVVGLLRAHIAALEADNAALLKGVQEMRNLLMYPHDEWHQVAADVIRVGNGLTAVDHPGATLLEEHRAMKEPEE